LPWILQTNAHENSTPYNRRKATKTDTLCFDPYLLTSELLTPLKYSKNLPNLTFADIYIYLVHNPSPFTGKALKAFKSTEAYRYFSGWVNDHKMYHSGDEENFLNHRKGQWQSVNQAILTLHQ